MSEFSQQKSDNTGAEPLFTTFYYYSDTGPGFRSFGEGIELKDTVIL
ncbi:MAG: hypothetical protein GX089_09540 [Fibrobacter sp.]|nr:hypothetical protein [Fibrobacter sp.]